MGNDSEDATISTAYNSKFIEPEHKLFRLVIDDVNKGVLIMKRILSKIKTSSLNFADTFKQEDNSESVKKNGEVKKWILLIDGKSFEIIKMNDYLFNHFCFLLHIFQGLIAFNFEPQQKANLLRIIKYRVFENSINLAVGNGYGNVGMIQESNIGIEIAIVKETQIINFSYMADIFCGDFNILNYLIFVISQCYHFKMNRFLIYLVYSSFLMTSPIFYFFWYTHLNGFLFSENFQFFYQNTLQFIIPTIFFFIYGKDLNEKILLNFPTIYKRKKQSKDNFNRNLLKQAVLAFFDSALIFFLSLFYSNLKNGNNCDYFNISSNVYILSTIFSFYYFFLQMNRIIFVFITSTFIAVFFFMLGFYFSELTYQLDAYNSNILSNLISILFNKQMFFLNSFLCCSLASVHFLVEKYADPLILNSVYQKIEDLIKISNNNCF